MNQTLSRAVSFGLMLAIGSAGMPLLAQDAVTPSQLAASAQNSSTPPLDLPDSPGAVNSQSSGGTQAGSTRSSAQSGQQSQPSEGRR